MVAAHENPGDLHGYCGGQDLLLGTSCTCPDIALQLRIRLSSGSTVGRKFVCTCCELEIMFDVTTMRPRLIRSP